MATKKRWVYVGICLATTFWGMSFLWTGQLLNLNFPMYSLIFLRIVIAAGILLVSLSLWRKLQRPKWKDFKWFALMTLLEPFLYFIGETNGIKITGSPTIASIIIATIPIFALAAGYYFFKERLSKTNIFGMLLSVFGVAVAMLDSNFSLSVDPVGVALLFFAVFTAVGYTLVTKKLSSSYNTFTIVTIQNVLGALFFLPFFFLESKEFAAFHLSWNAVYPLLMLALFPTCVSFMLYIHTLKIIGVSKTSMFTTLTPLVTMILAFIIGQEMVNEQKVIGALIAVAGLLLSQWTRNTFKEAKLSTPKE